MLPSGVNLEGLAVVPSDVSLEDLGVCLPPGVSLGDFAGQCLPPGVSLGDL
jgi:hypothetical protein